MVDANSKCDSLFLRGHTPINMAATFVEPSCHSYLGNQLRDARKKQQFSINPDATYTVLLVALPDVVLFPGETIPLRLQHQELVTRIEQIMQSSGTEADDQHFIGVISVLPGRHGRSTIASFGTTVEINSSHRARMDSRQLHPDEENRQEMILTGKGKFRFRLQSIRTDGPGIMYGRATLYEEEVLPRERLHPALNPFPRWVYTVNSPAVLAKRAYQLVESSLFWTAESTSALHRWGPLSEQATISGGSTASPQDTTSGSGASKHALSSPLSPPDTKRSRLRSRGDSGKGNGDSADATVEQEEYYFPGDDLLDDSTYGAERDPLRFSYFLAANLPVPTAQLQRLLEAQDAVDRLRLCIKLIEQGTGKVLACAVCGLPLAAKGEVFTVPGAEGVTGAYVNPHGAVHQTTTLRRLLDARAVLLHGSPTAQDSWFPGYAWTIASCARCLNHLGWKFTLVQDNPNRLQRFFEGAGVLSSAGHYLRVLRPAAADATDSNEGDNELDSEDADEEESNGSGSSGSDLGASAESFGSSESVDLGFDGRYDDGEDEDEGGGDHADGDGASVRDGEGEEGEYEENEGASEGREDGIALLRSGAEPHNEEERGLAAARREASAGDSAAGARVELFWGLRRSALTEV